MYMIINSRLTI